MGDRGPECRHSQPLFHVRHKPCGHGKFLIHKRSKVLLDSAPTLSGLHLTRLAFFSLRSISRMSSRQATAGKVSSGLSLGPHKQSICSALWGWNLTVPASTQLITTSAISTAPATWRRRMVVARRACPGQRTASWWWSWT